MNFPLSFNALAIKQAGAPVSLQQQRILSLNDDELLIQVSYASLNRMDASLARLNVFQFPLPYVLGFDFSGEVVQLGGKGQDMIQVGQQVFGRTLTGGCFAEYVVAKRGDVLPSGGVPAQLACTYGIAYLTAYESLVLTADITQYEGKWCYIAGAAGGVGHFAAQLAKLYGLRVIGSAGKATSLQLLQQLQLDHVIDYATQDVVQEIMRLTGGQGVDLVYDSTYTQSSYAQSAAVIALCGEYIRLGTSAQVARAGAEDMRPVVEGRGAIMVIGDLGRYRVDPMYQAQASKLQDGLRQAVCWYEAGQLAPVITETVSFSAGALQQAFEAFLSGANNVGKVIVKCR